MKLRGILLSTAAVMMSMSVAKAADAIVVEAEPMEYVKVCDMYGSGFFYIPGTETCMSISGYVRSTYAHAKDSRGALDTDVGPGEYNTSSWDYRGRLDFDVRNETEYGTLRSQLRIQGGDSNAAGDANVAIDRALISIAGFRLGYSDTYYDTNHDYGAGAPAIFDGFYDDDQAIFFDYTATLAEGVAVTVGVQDSNGTDAASPDFYAGFNASFGALTVAGTAIRDASVDEWAYKGSAILALGESGWTIGGWFAKDGGNTQYVTAYIDNSFDNEWGVQVNGALTDNFSVYGLYSEASGSSPTVGPVFANSDATQWSVGAVWAPVSGLDVQFEYTSTDIRGDFTGGGFGAVIDSESDAFIVRVTRSF